MYRDPIELFKNRGAPAPRPQTAQPRLSVPKPEPSRQSSFELPTDVQVPPPAPQPVNQPQPQTAAETAETKNDKQLALTQRAALAGLAVLGYVPASRTKLKRKDTEPYDYLKRFDGTHRTRRLEIDSGPLNLRTGEAKQGKVPPDYYLTLGKSVIEAAKLKQISNISHKIAMRNLRIHEITELHSGYDLLEGQGYDSHSREISVSKLRNPFKEWFRDFVPDKESAFSKKLKAMPRTRSQASNLKKNRREVRRLHRANATDTSTLIRAAGMDSPSSSS